jgi:hypothetical protein
MSITLTPEQQAQVNAMLKKFADRLLPAKLRNTNRNGLFLADYNVSRGLPINEDTLYDAAKAIYATLDWEIKPAKLVLEQESANKPVALENPLELDQKRQAIIKADEQKAKIEREFAALVTQCEDLIASYYPRKKMGALDYPEQAESQKKWKATLEDAKKKNNLERMRAYTKSLVATVKERYETQEKASERL